MDDFRWKVALAILYGCILCVCVVGNLLVCFYFTLDNRKLRHLQLLIFYLAVFDLLGGVLGPSLFIYLEITSYKQWHFGDVGCKLWGYLWKVVTSVSLGIIMVISIDRCMAVCQPFRPEVTKRSVKILVVLIMLLSMVLECPDLIYAKQKGNICEVPFVGSPGYGYSFVFIHSIRDFLYLSTFILTYIYIQKDLHRKSTNNTNVNRTTENKQVLKMLVVIATVFVLLTFPRDLLQIIYVASWLKGTGIRKTQDLLLINSILTVLLSCNRITNVFIYAKLHRRFRRVLTRKMSRALSLRHSQEENTPKGKTNSNTDDLLFGEEGGEGGEGGEEKITTS